MTEARLLAALGRRLAWRAREPSVIVVCGGTASGKTNLASGLAAASGRPHLSSDVIRKALLGLKPTDRAPDRAYGDELSSRTYEELGRRAKSELATGGAIVDATFRHRRDRDSFRRALGSSMPIFVECRAPPDVLERRARERMREPGRVSDADPTLVDRQLREFAPIDEASADRHLLVRTDRAVAAIEDDVEALLDTRLASGEDNRS